jgi:hypothetical protein
MIKTAHLYYHPHLAHTVQVTEQQGNWVEFYELDRKEPALRWLERGVFDLAYTHKNQGDPVQLDLPALREQAHSQGILVPREFA